VVPIVVTLVSVGVPLLAAGDDPGDRAATQSESSVEAAAAEVSYAKDVGAVCDDMNAAQAARRRAALRLRERLDRTKTTIAQRNALIDDTQSTIDRFTRVFGAFRELGAPDRLLRLHRDTAGAWGDSLERLRRYRTLLAGGFTRARLVAILERFPRKSGLVIEAQGVDVRAGLARAARGRRMRPGGAQDGACVHPPACRLAAAEAGSGSSGTDARSGASGTDARSGASKADARSGASGADPGGERRAGLLGSRIVRPHARKARRGRAFRQVGGPGLEPGTSRL
jgi:hypothetical protein